MDTYPVLAVIKQLNRKCIIKILCIDRINGKNNLVANIKPVFKVLIGNTLTNGGCKIEQLLVEGFVNATTAGNGAYFNRRVASLTKNLKHFSLDLALLAEIKIPDKYLLAINRLAGVSDRHYDFRQNLPVVSLKHKLAVGLGQHADNGGNTTGNNILHRAFTALMGG